MRLSYYKNYTSVNHKNDMATYNESYRLPPVSIGQRIAERLEILDISQAELARRVGVAQPTINALINRNKIGSKHLHRIARELGTTAEYLTAETDDPGPAYLASEHLTSEEREILDLLARLDARDRGAVLQIVRKLAGAANRETVHAGRQGYKGEEQA